MANDLPMPFIDEDNRPYWEACKRHEMVMQKCSDCGKFRFPPHVMCPYCNSFRSEWPKVSGKGHVFSWIVVHPPVLPVFKDRTPFPVVLIELEEGTRLVSHLLDCGAEETEIGMPVELDSFEDVSEEIALPMFRRAK